MNLARQTFLESYDDLYKEYQSPVAANKKAFWYEGDPNVSKAIFLAHGFMGTPEEMIYLAEPFIKKCWSVIGYLIPGHGSDAQDANAFKAQRWQRMMSLSLSLVTNHFEEVRAVGFSTGGLLLHDYLLHHPEPESLKYLHMISPYFIQRLPDIFWPAEMILSAVLEGMSVDRAYALTKFPDLKVMTIDREFYNQTIPAKTAKEIHYLGRMTYRKKGRITIPTQFYLSQGDWTVDTKATKKIMSKVYLNHELIWFDGREPHHLNASSVSKVAADIQKRIFGLA